MQVAPCWASPVPLPASSTRSVACRARGSESTDVAFNREMVCFSCIKSSCCLPREACPRSRARIYKYQRAPGCACCPSRSVPTPGALPAARGLAGSWQDPAGSWRERAVPAPAVEGVSARQDHSVAGSQRGRGQPRWHRSWWQWEWKSSRVPAWDPARGAEWHPQMDPGKKNLTACFSCWENGNGGVSLWLAEHSDTAQLGSSHHPEPGASPRLGAAMWAEPGCASSAGAGGTG